MENIQTNAQGQTYGTAASPQNNGSSAASPLVEPDLIAAYGKDHDGTPIKGYVLNADLRKDLPKNPEEAKEYMARTFVNGKAKTRTVNLYASDGVTVLGTFEAGGGSGGSIS